MQAFNFLDHPILFSTPIRLTRHSFWQEHIPFGMFLVQLLEPRLLVELGTHYGDSYCAFCQTVKELELATRCYAVDTWQGDVHIGEYSSAVLDELREHHDPLYGGFSNLVQNDFETARAGFAEGSIDLLHIDGTHTYEAVKSDFDGWLPKMSTRGVVLFHDTNVLDRKFGVRRFFDEIKNNYPHLEFLHGYGLGVLAVGSEQPAAFHSLLEANGRELAAIRRIFFALGQRILLLRRKQEHEEEIIRLNRNLAEMAGARQHDLTIHRHELATIHQQLADQAEFQAKLYEQNQQTIRALHTQLDLITGSRGWAMLQLLWRLRSLFKPRAILTPSQPVQPVRPAQQVEREELIETPPAPTVTLPVEATPNEDSAVLATFPEPLLTTEMLDSLNRETHQALQAQPAKDLRVIAFYLPQFHPIPENDEWWGKGFTEWTNVSKARPNFVGHYQPHLPGELGFYDLRLPEIREQQAELAKAHGIHGFCYHHYWFGGRRLLERPFNEVLQSGRPDFPFCVCWANENWTRRWDGLEHEILIGQNHSDEDDRNFIRNLFPAFDDHRYIRINGKPLLITYRVDVLPSAARTAERWREEARRAGLGELYLVAAQTCGFEDPRQFGYDAAVEFPPLNVTCENLIWQVTRLNPEFLGNVRDYGSMLTAMTQKPPSDFKVFRTVMPGWDNTARRRDVGHVYVHSSPEAYEYWLGQAALQTAATLSGDEQLVFINAWNEWGEGAHLEPDRQFGRHYLETTRRVVQIAKGPVAKEIQ
ncbi:MAG: glycoside hydrolase family 99-like domain-containing protein [Acidobacteriota bacterium]|nr:glycoside hydrolase family 99-like domain-containing protein [Acidobacteriota bacterium]